MLLSWPLRIYAECRTAMLNYQVTKLFGTCYLRYLLLTFSKSFFSLKLFFLFILLYLDHMNCNHCGLCTSHGISALKMGAFIPWEAGMSAFTVRSHSPIELYSLPNVFRPSYGQHVSIENCFCNVALVWIVISHPSFDAVRSAGAAIPRRAREKRCLRRQKAFG